MSSDRYYAKPFRVRVTEDVRKRPATRLNGERGYCLGLYEMFKTSERMPRSEMDKKDNWLTYNPLILTDSGHYIWGIQCYWEEAKGTGGVPQKVRQDPAALKSYIMKRAAPKRKTSHARRAA